MNNLFRQEALPILKEGNTGSDVILLQQKLKVLKLYNASITGSFDYYTKLIVKLFQEQNGLEIDGIVGIDTWKLLNDMTSQDLRQETNYPTLRLGDTGNYVRTLQTRLSNLMYYDGEINGTFDTETENAVKAFQINNNLTADGIVGRFTWSALETLYSPLAICNGESLENLVYTVKSGDTLYSIAKKYGVTVNQIKDLNNLTSNTISIGQQLLIPTTETENIYTVQNGDTLYSIAKKFNTTVNEIKSLNNLTSNTISIGQKLKIPSPINTSNIIYTVKSGDTLYSIAKKYNVTVDEIKKLNNLTNNTISINQQLLIPTTSNVTTYTVKSGDTLYSIAKRYNTTVNEIKSVNNLTTNILSIGQQLKIPN